MKQHLINIESLITFCTIVAAIVGGITLIWLLLIYIDTCKIHKQIKDKERTNRDNKYLNFK